MHTGPSATETRAVFGQNLRTLVAQHKSVSQVCRLIGVNRAQFNRYLSGDSYPRPDTLKQICDFFGTDARILVEPLEHIMQERPDLLRHPAIQDYTAPDKALVPEDSLPTGFYRFSRRSFLYPETCAINLLYVSREDDYTFIRGIEARKSFVDQGLPIDIKSRTYKGYVQRMEDGLCTLITRQGGLTGTFNFFSPVVSMNRNFWHGYAIRTVQESLNASRVTRVVFEYLGDNTRDILSTARMNGFCNEEDLLPFHKRLLRLELPFA